MLKAILQRDYVTETKDSAGEKTTIGTFEMYKDNDLIFQCYTAENAGEPTDKAGQDKPVVPRKYGLLWNFTRVGTCKKYFEKVDYDDFADRILPAYRCRYDDYGFTNIGLQLWTKELKSFESRWIFIHRGNTGKDTQGCLLLGYERNDNQILKSTDAISDFYALIDDLYELDSNYKIKNFELEVRHFS